MDGGVRSKINRSMKYWSLLALGTLLLFACKQTALKEGEQYLPVQGGKIWYKVIGKGPKTPIVMLHGGPGFPSYYLTPLFALADDRPIIVYDQLGCGRSDQLEDTSLMNIASQQKDLEALLHHLNIKDYYLYAHSYGTLLAVKHYTTGLLQPKAMILASPCINTIRWELDADTLITSMDSQFRKPLMQFKAGNLTDTTHLAAALNQFYASFYNRTMNGYIDSSLNKSNKQLYQHMWGKEDFMLTGNLKHMDLTKDLSKITVPVLYTAGAFDAARPSTVQYYQSLTPKARFVLIPNAAHSTMNDNTKANLAAIRVFVRSLEK